MWLSTSGTGAFQPGTPTYIHTIPYISHANANVQGSFQALVPPILPSTQQPCEVVVAENELLAQG